MNKTLKYVGLFSVLPLFTVALTTSNVIDVFADGHELVCMEGETVVIRVNNPKPICVPDDTAQRWEQLGIATIVGGPAEEAMEEEMEEAMGVEMEEAMEEEMMEEAMEEEMMEETMEEEMEAAPGSVLRLSRANVPATIPLHQGYYNGEAVYYIITDSSDPKHADIITENQGWQVELAPLLANAPDVALSTTYMFTNGVEGDGVHGYQAEVFTSTPAQPDVYSALTSHVHVTWNEEGDAELLDSEDAIMDAEGSGVVTLTEIDVVLNMPQIVWPGGQMPVNEGATLADDMPYGGGQVTDINTDEMTVTFIAHRGWGPDGRTIYYIVTDATPSGPAAMMGVVDAPTSASLIANSAAVDLFQFRNGIAGSGPLGFQAGIAAGAPGDANYSPMWRISMIGWEDPDSASLLETKGDIDHFQSEGLISVGLARPMDSDHIVNCPFIDPFQ